MNPTITALLARAPKGVAVLVSAFMLAIAIYLFATEQRYETASLLVTNAAALLAPSPWQHSAKSEPTSPV